MRAIDVPVICRGWLVDGERPADADNDDLVDWKTKNALLPIDAAWLRRFIDAGTLVATNPSFEGLGCPSDGIRLFSDEGAAVEYGSRDPVIGSGMAQPEPVFYFAIEPPLYEAIREKIMLANRPPVCCVLEPQYDRLVLVFQKREEAEARLQEILEIAQ